jgi:dynein heavy chain
MLIVNTINVPTVDTVRLSSFIENLVKNRKPIMFVGTGGTGKTSICRSYISQLSPDEYSNAIINLNSYTDATTLRTIMQQYVDKRSGRTYGPPRGKLIYYIDDLNMPYVDTYGTQSPIALIRCHMDYGLWYDCDESDPNRKKKLIQDAQYIASMNHKSGSFTVNPRLMGHFLVLVCNTPTRDDMRTIYRSILAGHLELFDDKIKKLCEPIANGTIDLLLGLNKSPKFRPTTAKFHYQFNIRDVSNIFQGMVLSKPGLFDEVSFIRLWMHECMRVFGDRMVDDADLEAFRTKLLDMSKKNFDFDQDKISEEPNIFTNFVPESEGKEVGSYIPCSGYDKLNQV